MELRELGIYIHIPFCKRKCAYCDFPSGEIGPDSGIVAAYMAQLKKEINQFPGSAAYQVKSIFFGGGTPSYIEETYIGEIVGTIKERFSVAANAEITLEMNPGTADRNKLQYYRRIGINRLSIGLQSANDRELALLGRIHTWDEFREMYAAAREAGFVNINIDLMSALPGQRKEDWQASLQRVLALEPEHISAYSLIIEEGTPFYTKYQEDVRRRENGETPLLLPDEEVEREMYDLTGQLLGESGYKRYEISNYAKSGYECIHNIGYWQRREYAGFGLSAASLINGVRYTNPAELRLYLAAGSGNEAMHPDDPEEFQNIWAVERQVLTSREAMEEFLFLGLRLMRGISLKAFQQQFGLRLMEEYGTVVQKLIVQKMLVLEGDRMYLSPRGIDVSNYVLAEFL